MTGYKRFTDPAMLALLFTGMVQFSVAVWWASGLDKRMESCENWVSRTQDMPIAVARVEEQINRFGGNIEMLNSQLEKFSDKIEVITFKVAEKEGRDHGKATARELMRLNNE